jgi:C-terminal processing protease CtpA/Prc
VPREIAPNPTTGASRSAAALCAAVLALPVSAAEPVSASASAEPIQTSTTSAAALPVSAASAFAPAAQSGWFGLEIAVRTSGFFGSAVTSVTIVSVRRDSPASAANLSAGDEVVSIEDHLAAGINPKVLRELSRKAVGQILHLAIRRPDGQTHPVALTAVSRPVRD